MREFISISKALADPNRVRILLVLREGELCVCQLTELFGLAPSTMSKHLAILYQARLVNTRKEGRRVYYSRAGKEAAAAVRAALEWVDLAVAESEQAAADARRLGEVLKMELARLCGGQCRS